MHVLSKRSLPRHCVGSQLGVKSMGNTFIKARKGDLLPTSFGSSEVKSTTSPRRTSKRKSASETLTSQGVEMLTMLREELV